MGPDDQEYISDEFSETHAEGLFQSLTLDFADKDEAGVPWPDIFERHLDSLTHRSTQRLAAASKVPASKNETPIKNTAQTRAQTRSGDPRRPSLDEEPVDPRSLSFQFSGGGYDAEDFMATGWLNPLPSQNNIPGWMRWTMMKFFVNLSEGGSSSGDFDPFNVEEVNYNHHAIDYDNIDDEALWAYEGIVLPGGQIVVGRWWCADDSDPGVGLGKTPAPATGEGECYSGPFLFWCVDE